MIRWIRDAIVEWLVTDLRPRDMPLESYERLCDEIAPGDVLLVSGRTRVAGVIQSITLSSWSHAALYAGRLSDLPPDPKIEALAREHGWDPDRHMLLEAELGLGSTIVPLDKYQGEHLRLCRPRELVPGDAERVVGYVIGRLGTEYDVRQILDLLRFFLPYAIMPRRWRSTLFGFRSGAHTRTVCSTLIAEAFASVRFPVLPVIQRAGEDRYVFYRRNFRLMTPRDFDYSPYFDVIKYPILGGDDISIYHDMPWGSDGVLCNTSGDCFEVPVDTP